MKKSDSEKLRELLTENKRLKIEVEALKRELENDGKAVHPRNDHTTAAFDKATKNERLYSRKYYTTYLFESIRSNSFFNIYEHIIRALRKYTVIATTLRILTVIVAFIESSAIFVVFASAFVVSVPIMVLVSYAAIVMSFLGSKKLNRRNKELLTDKHVTIMFPPRGKAFSEGSYFRGLATDIASQEENVVVIVSPYTFRAKGICDKNTPYIASRHDSESILIVRRHYYFTLKKRILGSMKDKTTVIY